LSTLTNDKKLKGLVIVGPTAVGKTDLSVRLAKELGVEIISADSAQVYKGLDVGTAKVSLEEMRGVVHHLIDVVEPIKKYNVGEYQKAVNDILAEKEKLNENILLTGGTGLYVNSVTEGLSVLPEGDKELREKLMLKSSEELYNELKKVDPESALNIHMNNKRRVERALEVYKLTGKKFSVISKQNVKGNNYDFLKIGLERDRQNLYDRIDLRVDIMVKAGLIEEVKGLYDIYGENLRKINIIGYSEVIDYFKGLHDFETAVELVKRNSRRYAKRQFTWFKNDNKIKWFDVEKKTDSEIMENVLKEFYSF